MSRFQLVSSVDGAMKKPVSPSRDLQTHTEERGRFCCFLFSSFVSFFRDLNIYATSLANNHSRDGREREREGPAGGKSATLVNKTREKKTRFTVQLSDRVNVSQAHRVTKHRPGDDSEMDGNIVEKVKERRVEWGAKNIRTERERKQKSHHHSWLSCTTPRKEEKKNANRRSSQFGNTRET